MALEMSEKVSGIRVKPGDKILIDGAPAVVVVIGHGFFHAVDTSLVIHRKRRLGTVLYERVNDSVG